MLSRILTRAGLLILLSGLLFGCEPPEPIGASKALRAGTVAYYKISGHQYRAEVTEVKNGYIVWEFTWKKTPVFKFKTYRGLFAVYSEEEGFKIWSQFDPQVLDRFLPLEVGREIQFEGRQYTKRIEGGFPFFVTIKVRDKGQIEINGKTFPVFILDYAFVEEHPDGTKTLTKTAWYSEELQASLRTDYRWERGTFSMQMISMDEAPGPGSDDNEDPEGLGTIRL